MNTCEISITQNVYTRHVTLYLSKAIAITSNA